MSAERDLIHVEGDARIYNRRHILVVLMIPIAMALMSISSITVALPAIQEGIGATDSDVQWLLSGYALAFGVSLVPFGRVGDVLGRGVVFVGGLAVFTLASLGCGVVSDPLWLNLMRLIQGVGAGMYNPQVTGMIQKYFSGIGRAKAYAILGMVISASVAVGPVVAGLIITAFGPHNGWRANFLINVPIGLAGVGLALWCFPFDTEKRRRRGELTHTRIDLDGVGSLLLMVTVVAIMWPFISHSDNGLVWLLLPTAVLLGWGWIRWERRYKAAGKQPMVDLDLFRIESFSYGIAASGVSFLGNTTTFVLVAMFLQRGLGESAMAAGLIGLPNAIASMAGSAWAAPRTINHGRRLMALATLWTTGGFIVALFVIGAMQWWGISFWWLALPLGVLGWGLGTFNSFNQTIAMGEIPVEQAGAAGAIKSTTERIGTAVGNAVLTAVFFSLVHRGWTQALAGSFGVIIVIMLIVTVITVTDVRRHGPSAIVN